MPIGITRDASCGGSGRAGGVDRGGDGHGGKRAGIYIYIFGNIPGQAQAFRVAGCNSADHHSLRPNFIEFFTRQAGVHIRPGSQPLSLGLRDR